MLLESGTIFILVIFKRSEKYPLLQTFGKRELKLKYFFFFEIFSGKNFLQHGKPEKNEVILAVSPSGIDPKSSLPERRAPRNFEQAVSPENFS